MNHEKEVLRLEQLIYIPISKLVYEPDEVNPVSVKVFSDGDEIGKVRVYKMGGSFHYGTTYDELNAELVHWNKIYEKNKEDFEGAIVELLNYPTKISVGTFRKVFYVDHNGHKRTAEFLYETAGYWRVHIPGIN